MSEFSKQIAEISHNATLAAHNKEVDGEFYQRYHQSLKTLLLTIAPTNNPDMLRSYDKLIDAIYSVHEEMLDKPEYDELHTQQLQNYLESLIIEGKYHPEYLQHWSLQNILNALYLENPDPFIENVDDFITNSTRELEEMFALEQQKSDLLTQDDMDDLSDDDNLEEEMAAILNFTYEDMHAAIEEREIPDNTTQTSDSSRSSNSELSSSSVVNEQGLEQPDTPDHTTEASDSEISPHSVVNDPEFIAITDKFNQIMIHFQNLSLPKNIKSQERRIIENDTKQIANNIISLYKNCFHNGVHEEEASQFEKATRSIITNWSHWKEKELSPNASPIIAQNLAKLTMSLHKLTEEIRTKYSLDTDEDTNSEHRKSM